MRGAGAGSEVALQALGVVAGVPAAAVLVQLLGAHLAAAAAVEDEPHAGGAPGGLNGAAALGGAHGGHQVDGSDQNKGHAHGLLHG